MRARQGDLQAGQQVYAEMQQLSADVSQPAELRALADVLIRILVGEANPDLSVLPDELRQAVQGLLARLAGA